MPGLTDPSFPICGLCGFAQDSAPTDKGGYHDHCVNEEKNRTETPMDYCLADPTRKATPKAPAIDELLTAITGKDRVETINTDDCVMCDAPNVEFRNQISEDEYRISGMCQDCQDKTFGVD